MKRLPKWKEIFIKEMEEMEDITDEALFDDIVYENIERLYGNILWEFEYKVALFKKRIRI